MVNSSLQVQRFFFDKLPPVLISVLDKRRVYGDGAPFLLVLLIFTSLYTLICILLHVLDYTENNCIVHYMFLYYNLPFLSFNDLAYDYYISYYYLLQ